MSQFATIDRTRLSNAILRVVGVGGGGCNAVESMIRRGLGGVEYIAVNTDAQVLENSSAHQKIQVGTKLTKGLGAGADPTIGKKAIDEDAAKIEDALRGSDMVFITAGMGGGTGTGGAPVVASIAKSLGALVVGIVTKPFPWEGQKRSGNAEKGILELRQHVDSLIVIPNSRLSAILEGSVGALQAFDKPNEVLYEATRGIADIITIQGLINVDFADVRSVMSQSGVAIMGCGIASGDNRTIEAAQKAISSPLLEGISVKGAKSILLNVTGSSNLTMKEIEDGNNIIYNAAGQEANVIFGFVIKEEMNDYVSYTVIATGFDERQSIGGARVTQPADAPVPGSGTGRQNPFPSGFKTTASSITVDMSDLDTPTYKRHAMASNPEQGIQQSLEMPEADERYQQVSAEAQQRKIENSKKQVLGRGKPSGKDDDSDSSSFLRMMMMD